MGISVPSADEMIKFPLWLILREGEALETGFFFFGNPDNQSLFKVETPYSQVPDGGTGNCRFGHETQFKGLVW